MPIYNLLECSKNYWKTAVSFWNYYGDEPKNPPLNDDGPPLLITLQTSKQILSLLNTKAVLQEKKSNVNQENGENTEQGNTKTKKNLEIVVPLKHISNF